MAIPLHRFLRSFRKRLASALSWAALASRRLGSKWLGKLPAMEILGRPLGRRLSTRTQPAPVPASPPQFRELADRLRTQKQLLIKFSDDLEKDFLNLGETLQAMNQPAQSIRQDYQRVLALTASQEEDSALLFSMQLLNKAEDLILAAHERFNQVFSVFKEVERAVENTGAQQEELQGAWATLPFIVVQFRVQASIFAESIRESFTALADEIEVLLRRARSTVGEQFEQLERTRTLTNQLAAELAATIVDQKTEVMSVVGASRQSLRALNQALADSSNVVQDMAQRSHGATKQIERVVHALQYQDITRQEIQHVCQAIDEMVMHLEQALASPADAAAMAGLDGYVKEASFLQSRQIKAVFDQLDQAAGEISSGIRGIHEATKTLCEGAERSGRLALESGVVHQSIQGMQNILAISEATLRRTDDVFQGIAPLQSTFTEYTSQITDLARGVRLGALNAQVHSEHVAGGGALAVLAEQTRLVSDRGMEAVGLLSGQLAAIESSIKDLRQTLEDFQALAREEQAILAQEAALSESKLRSLQDDLPKQLGQIGPRLAELTALMEQGASQLHFAEAAAETKAACVALFVELAQGRQEPPDPTTEAAIADHRLEQLKRNYTMAGEHRIHEQAVQGLEPSRVLETPAPVLVAEPQDAALATPRPAPPGANLGLGDNVELF